MCDERLPMVGNLIVKLYGLRSDFIRRMLLKVLIRFEGPHYQFYSKTLRRIFALHHGVDVGMYSHGACFTPRAFPPGTRIGRYCSVAISVKAHAANHAMNLKSSHAFFFNPNLEIAKERLVPTQPPEIGNDVWIGDNAIILPSAHKIGDGAVVGAGAMVNKDVPPYAVVVGNPARVVRFRFSKEKIAELLEEEWWKRSIEDIRDRSLEEFQIPIEAEEVR
jgi:virginiamycin A acetyltransferase